MKNEWKDIEGFEGDFQINRKGEVLNKNTGRILKVSANRDGYVRCNLYRDGKDNMRTVHRLVAMAFIPNPKNHPQVHHKDGNKENNLVENLEWVSPREHARKMLPEQKRKFTETYQNNLKKRKMVMDCHY